MYHSDYRNIIEVAQYRGSAAKSKSGAWKYLKSHLPKSHAGLVALKSRNAHHNTIFVHRIGTAIAMPIGCHRDAAAVAVYQQARVTRRADRIAAVLGYPLQSEQYAWYYQAYLDNAEYDRRADQIIWRDGYGALYAQSTDGRPTEGYNSLYWAARDLVTAAATTGAIAPEHDGITWDHKRRADGSAVHHELYDYAPGVALVCVRHTEGGRYGVKTLSKTYYLVERIEEAVVATITTRPVAKYAKLPDIQPGQVIAAVCGDAGAPKLPSPKNTHHGYKLLALTYEGEVVSVWDGSQYALGKTRTERAEYHHLGGLYYYRDLSQALAAAHDNSIFCEAINHHRLAVCEVRASGRQIKYSAGKYAASHITPLAIIAMTI